MGLFSRHRKEEPRHGGDDTTMVFYHEGATANGATRDAGDTDMTAAPDTDRKTSATHTGTTDAHKAAHPSRDNRSVEQDDGIAPRSESSSERVDNKCHEETARGSHEDVSDHENGRDVPPQGGVFTVPNGQPCPSVADMCDTLDEGTVVVKSTVGAAVFTLSGGRIHHIDTDTPTEEVFSTLYDLCRQRHGAAGLSHRALSIDSMLVHNGWMVNDDLVAMLSQEQPPQTVNDGGRTGIPAIVWSYDEDGVPHRAIPTTETTILARDITTTMRAAFSYEVELAAAVMGGDDIEWSRSGIGDDEVAFTHARMSPNHVDKLISHMGTCVSALVSRYGDEGASPQNMYVRLMHPLEGTDCVTAYVSRMFGAAPSLLGNAFGSPWDTAVRPSSFDVSRVLNKLLEAGDARVCDVNDQARDGNDHVWDDTPRRGALYAVPDHDDRRDTSRPDDGDTTFSPRDDRREETPSDAENDGRSSLDGFISPVNDLFASRSTDITVASPDIHEGNANADVTATGRENDRHRVNRVAEDTPVEHGDASSRPGTFDYGALIDAPQSRPPSDENHRVEDQPPAVHHGDEEGQSGVTGSPRDSHYDDRESWIQPALVDDHHDSYAPRSFPAGSTPVFEALVARMGDPFQS